MSSKAWRFCKVSVERQNLIDSPNTGVTVQGIQIIQQQQIRYCFVVGQERGGTVPVIPGIKYINFSVMMDEKRHHGIGIAVFDQHKLIL